MNPRYWSSDASSHRSASGTHRCPHTCRPIPGYNPDCIQLEHIHPRIAEFPVDNPPERDYSYDHRRWVCNPRDIHTQRYLPYWCTRGCNHRKEGRHTHPHPGNLACPWPAHSPFRRHRHGYLKDWCRCRYSFHSPASTHQCRRNRIHLELARNPFHKRRQIPQVDSSRAASIGHCYRGTHQCPDRCAYPRIGHSPRDRRTESHQARSGKSGSNSHWPESTHQCPSMYALMGFRMRLNQ